MPNRDDAAFEAVSLDALRQIAGLDVFPTLPAATRARAMELPEPRTYSRGDAEDAPRRKPRTEESFADWAKAELHRALRRLWRDLMRAAF